MTSGLLDADRLYRFYRSGDEECLALQGVSLRLHPGEVVAVTGPSGSGKSTLLRCLTGTDEPSGGTVWLAGERLSHRSDAERAGLRARHLGILEQERNLFAHLTVEANVRLAQSLAPRSSARRTPGRQPVRPLLERLELDHRRRAVPSELSGGETARAGLAVALANDPEIVVADEPTGELDTETEGRVLTLLRAHADSGGCVLVASHSPAVRRLADRVVVGSSRVDLQACKLEYSIVSPK